MAREVVCRSCGQLHDPMRPCPKPVTATVTRVTPMVTQTHCPTCGKPVRKFKSAADKQRAYRERQKV